VAEVLDWWLRLSKPPEAKASSAHSGGFFAVISLPGFESLSRQTKRITVQIRLEAEVLDWWLRSSTGG